MDVRNYWALQGSHYQGKIRPSPLTSPPPQGALMDDSPEALLTERRREKTEKMVLKGSPLNNSSLPETP